MKKNLFLTLLISIAMFLGFNVANAEALKMKCEDLEDAAVVNGFDKRCTIFSEGKITKDQSYTFVITSVIGFNPDKKEGLVKGTEDVELADKSISDVSAITTDNPFEVSFKYTGETGEEKNLAYLYFDDDDKRAEEDPVYECGATFAFKNTTPNTPTTPETDEDETPEDEEENKPTGDSSTNTPSTNPSTDDDDETEEEEEPNASTSTSTDEKKCDIKDGKYYGPNGELLEDKAAYDKVCGSKNDKVEDKCEIKDGKYYGPNGELLEDKAAYDKVCRSKNYKDGYGNPYVLLGFGVALIAGVVTVSKKNKLFN